MSVKIKIETKGLDQLIKAMDSKATVRIGVLRGGSRTDGSTNAAILLKHEFGEEGLPIRSPIRVPLMDNLQQYLEEAGAFDEASFEKVVDSGTFHNWLEKIGLVAEKVIQDAFDTGGFGKWPPSNMKLKKNHQTLVETQQLRNSITSEVKE